MLCESVCVYIIQLAAQPLRFEHFLSIKTHFTHVLCQNKRKPDAAKQNTGNSK